MAESVRCRSYGGVLAFGRHASTKRSSSDHCTSLSIIPPALEKGKRVSRQSIQATTGLSRRARTRRCEASRAALHPQARSRRITAASSPEARSRRDGAPASQAAPVIATKPFTAAGTPSRGPRAACQRCPQRRVAPGPHSHGRTRRCRRSHPALRLAEMCLVDRVWPERAVQVAGGERDRRTEARAVAAVCGSRKGRHGKSSGTS